MTKLEECTEVIWHSAQYNERTQCKRPELPRAMCLQVARAVIKALREPSEAMVEAGRSVLDEHGCNPLTGDTQFAWQAMIDTILNEGKDHD